MSSLVSPDSGLVHLQNQASSKFCAVQLLAEEKTTCFQNWAGICSLPDDGDVHVDDLELVGPWDLQGRLQHVQKLTQVLVVNVLRP
jgi:hypothetical protein